MSIMRRQGNLFTKIQRKSDRNPNIKIQRINLPRNNESVKYKIIRHNSLLSQKEKVVEIPIRGIIVSDKKLGNKIIYYNNKPNEETKEN